MPTLLEDFLLAIENNVKLNFLNDVGSKIKSSTFYNLIVKHDLFFKAIDQSMVVVKQLLQFNPRYFVSFCDSRGTNCTGYAIQTGNWSAIAYFIEKRRFPIWYCERGYAHNLGDLLFAFQSKNISLLRQCATLPAFQNHYQIPFGAEPFIIKIFFNKMTISNQYMFICRAILGNHTALVLELVSSFDFYLFVFMATSAKWHILDLLAEKWNLSALDKFHVLEQTQPDECRMYCWFTDHELCTCQIHKDMFIDNHDVIGVVCIAVRYGVLPIIKWYLENCKDETADGHYGFSYGALPIFVSIEYNQFGLFKMMFPKYNHQIWNAMSMLDYCIKMKNIEFFNYAISQKTTLKLNDSFINDTTKIADTTIFQWLVENHKNKLSPLSLEYAAAACVHPKMLFTLSTMFHEHENAMRIVIQQGYLAGVKALAYYMQPELMVYIATEHRQPEIIQWLLQQYPNMNKEYFQNNGMTAFQVALLYKDRETIKSLIDWAHIDDLSQNVRSFVDNGDTILALFLFKHGAILEGRTSKLISEDAVQARLEFLLKPMFGIHSILIANFLASVQNFNEWMTSEPVCENCGQVHYYTHVQ